MTDVFISYSRKDIAFARLINEALINSGLETWIDWDRIPISSNWWNEICQAILGANVVMFVTSGSSIQSDWCQKEIQQALEHKKRIIPVIVDETPDAVVSQCMPAIAWIQRLDCRQERAFFLETVQTGPVNPDEEKVTALPKDPQFREALEKLTKAIQVDHAWMKAHTELEQAAQEWYIHEKDPSRLMKGAKLREAETWLGQGTGKDSQPTLLQTQFISASRQEETRLQEEKLRMEKRSSQNLRMGIAAIAIGLALALFLGANWYNQRNQYFAEANSRATAEANAVSEAQFRATAQVKAETASTQAVEQRDEALRQAALALSGKLATDSSMLYRTHIDTSLLLALESYQVAQNTQSRGALLNALLANPRLRHVLPVGDSAVLSVAFSPDGKLLAAGGCAKYTDIITCQQSLIQLWDTSTGKLVASLYGEANTSGVRQLAFRKDGKTLLAASEAGNLAEWDIDREKQTGAFQWRDKRATDIAFSPDRKVMAVAACGSPGTEAQGMCRQGEVVLYDTVLHKPIGAPFTDHTAYAYSLAFNQDGRWLATGGADGRVFLYDLGTGQHRLMLEVGPSSAFFSLAFSPDGKTLAAGDMNGQVTFIDVASGKAGSTPLRTHDTVFGLAYRPDGKMLATSGCGRRLSDCVEGEILLWDADKHAMIGQALSGFPSYLNAITFSADGKLLAGGSRQNLAIWEADGDQPLARMISSLPNSFVMSSAFSSDGNWLAAANGTNLNFWDIRTENTAHTNLAGHTGQVEALRFLPGGEKLLSASMDKTVILWDAAAGKEIARPITGLGGLYHQAVLSPNRALLAAFDASALVVFDTSTGKEITRVGGIEGNGLAFKPDGSQVAVLGCANRVEKSDGSKSCQQWRAQIFDVTSGRQFGSDMFGHAGRMTGIAFSRDGRRIATGGEDKRIVFWNVQTGQPVGASVDLSKLWTGDYDRPDQLAFSPDGKYLVVGSGSRNQVMVLDIETAMPVGAPVDKCYNLDELVFSPDGKVLAIGCSDVQFYDMVSLEPKEHLSLTDEGNGDRGTHFVSGIAFSPDGRYLAAGCVEGDIYIWDLSVQPAVIKTKLFGHASGMVRVGFSSDSHTLLSLSDDLTLNRWDASALYASPSKIKEIPLIGQPLKGYRDHNASVTFSDDGSLFVSVSCRIKKDLDCAQSEVWLYEMPSGRNVASFQFEGKPGDIAIHPNHQTIAVFTSTKRSATSDLDVPGKILFWDLADQGFINPPIEGLIGDNENLAYSPDGAYLAVTGPHMGALFQTAGSHEEVYPLSTGIYRLAFSPDGNYLVEGGTRLLTLRELQTGKVMGQLITGEQVLSYSLSFSPSGLQLASGDNNGHLLLWDLDPDSWKTIACRIANRSLTGAEWSTYLGAIPYRQVCQTGL